MAVDRILRELQISESLHREEARLLAFGAARGLSAVDCGRLRSIGTLTTAHLMGLIDGGIRHLDRLVAAEFVVEAMRESLSGAKADLDTYGEGAAISTYFDKLVKQALDGANEDQP